MQKIPFNKLLIATGNRHKYEEIKGELDSFDIETIPAFDYDIKEPEETGKTFEENSLLKAKYYSETLNMPALADDSGLCIEALNGEPGIYSARWARECGSYEKVAQKIQEKLANKKTQNFNAFFICAITIFGLGDKYKNFHSFKGKVEGILKFPPKGNNGFGYDPIFVPKRYNVSFGEMSPVEKKEISHRAIALEQFKKWLNDFS